MIGTLCALGGVFCTAGAAVAMRTLCVMYEAELRTRLR